MTTCIYNTKLKAALAALFVLGSATTLHAQPRLVPEQDITKVGELLYGKPHTFSLAFVNKGDKPLQIVEMEPSCGCTTAEYDGKPVAPGERGEVKFTYDAFTLGTFHKEVKILTNAGPEPVYMAIQGVVRTQVTDYGTDYPIDLGNVRLKENSVEFDDVRQGDHPQQVIELINTDRTAYEPQLMHLPAYLTATCEPEVIASGKTGRITLTLDSDKLYQLGLNQTSVYLARYMGDKVSDDNEIVVSAVLLPSIEGQVPGQTGELNLPAEQLTFALNPKKRRLTQKLVVANTGQTTLHILGLQVFSKALSVSLGNKAIKPGKSTKLKVTLDCELLQKSKTRPRVLLITDDPQQTKTVIDIHTTSTPQ